MEATAIGKQEVGIKISPEAKTPPTTTSDTASKKLGQAIRKISSPSKQMHALADEVKVRRQRPGETDEAYFKRLNTMAESNEKARAALRNEQLQHDKNERNTWENLKQKAGLLTTAASIAAPGILQEVGIGNQAPAIVLGMLANGMAAEGIGPTEKIDTKLKEFSLGKQMEKIVTKGEVGVRLLASLIVNLPNISSENLLEGGTPDSLKVLFDSLLEREKMQGVPEIVARHQAVMKYTEIQQRAQNLRESRGNNVKKQAFKLADIGMGLAAGFILAKIGNSVGQEMHSPLMAGVTNGLDDAARLGMIAKRLVSSKLPLKQLI